jgi:hypothetical protein
MKKKPKMKKIFVVDAENIQINSTEISKDMWEKCLANSGVFTAMVDGRQIFVMPHAWRFSGAKFVTYAGFATKQGAKNFKDTMDKALH